MSKQQHDELVARDYRHVEYGKSWFREALGVIGTIDPSSLTNCLDYGCGNGEFAELLKRQYGWLNVSCLDYAGAICHELRSLASIRCTAIWTMRKTFLTFSRYTQTVST